MSVTPPAPEPTPPTPPADEAKFTQADLDRHIADRLNRQKAQYPDYDAIKAKAAKLDELELANASDLEKANAAAKTAADERDAALAQAKQMKIEAAVMAEAAKAKAIDPAAVFALLPKDKVTIGDDGQVTGVEDAVKALLDDKKYLVGGANGGANGSGEGGPQGGGLPPQLSREDLKTMSPDEIVQAKADGRLKTLLSGATT